MKKLIKNDYAIRLVLGFDRIIILLSYFMSGSRMEGCA
jgi:hypothetical protein